MEHGNGEAIIMGEVQAEYQFFSQGNAFNMQASKRTVNYRTGQKSLWHCII